MSESYQAIYDAVRSRISGGNVGEIVANAARDAFDISNQKAYLAQEFSIAAAELVRPSVVYKAELRRDGKQWIASFGLDLDGYGASPEEAMRDFDTKWHIKAAA